MGDMCARSIIYSILMMYVFLPCLCDYRSDFCEEPRLLNGRVRLRAGGTIAKFNCRQGYYLWGVKYTTCILGRWDVEPPICIRTGCRALTPLYKGKISVSFQGALALLICDYGYKIVINGFSLDKTFVYVYCDGRKWNVTSYACRAEPTTPKPTIIQPTSPVPSESTIMVTESETATSPTDNTPLLTTISSTLPPPSSLAPPPPPPTPPPPPPPPTPPPPPPPPQPLPTSFPSTSVSPSTTALPKIILTQDVGTWCDFDLRDRNGSSIPIQVDGNGQVVRRDTNCGWTGKRSSQSPATWIRIFGGIFNVTGKPDRSFLYASATGRSKAELESPGFRSALSGQNGNPACFIFYYKCYKANLTVVLRTEDNPTDGDIPLWTAKADSGVWIRGYVPLRPLSRTFWLSFVVDFGNASTASVSLDNLLLTMGEDCKDNGTGNSDGQGPVGNGTQPLSPLPFTSKVNTAAPTTSFIPPSSKAATITTKTTTKPPPTSKVTPSPSPLPTKTVTSAFTAPSTRRYPSRRPVTKPPVWPVTRSTTTAKPTRKSTTRATPRTTPRTTTRTTPRTTTRTTTRTTPRTTTRTTPRIITSTTKVSPRTTISTESDMVTVPGYKGRTHSADKVEEQGDSGISLPVIVGASLACLFVLAVVGSMLWIRRRRRRIREGGDGDSDVRFLTGAEEQLDFTLQKVCEDYHND